MNLQQLFRLARAFTDLGWSIQEQLNQALDGDIYALNPAAARQIIRWLHAADRAGAEGAGALAAELEEEYAEHMH